MPASKRFVFRIAILLSLLAAPVAQAAGAPAYTYIDPASLPPMLLLPPPAEGSAAWRREVAGVLEAQSHISAADRAAMRDEQHMRLELMTGVIGKDFTRERFPKTFAFLDRVLADTFLVTEADKRYWHTRRPYLTDHQIKILIDPINKSPAYPSGHTSSARVLAEILGLLYPQKLAELRARAAMIAQHRVEAGVHYPVDIKGGETLAAMILGALMAHDGFQNDLEDAEDEIAEAQQAQ